RDFSFPADSRDIGLEYGPSQFDITHRLVGYWTWELPFGRGRHWLSSSNGFLDQLVGGWTYAGTANWRSGFPFTVWADQNADWRGLNQFGDRVRLSGIPLVTHMNDPDNAFNGSAFLTPTIGSVGTVGRNAFRGPGFISFDMSVAKSFRMTEGTNLQFKADFFN